MSKHKQLIKTVILSFFFSFMMLFEVSSQIFPPVGMHGSGTSNDPWQITNYSHLRALADYVNAGNGDSTNGKYYKLMNDIDLSGDTNWEPIGEYNNAQSSIVYFQGNFDGNCKVIQNIKIYRPTEYDIGFFGVAYNANIEKLGVENCNIIGGKYVGSLVGYNNNSTISNCYVIGIVTGNDNEVGGLVGLNHNNSTISNSYAICNVTGNGSLGYIGGLVGYNSSSTIYSCYATGDVNGTSEVGGLVGINYNSIISNCYATSNVSGLQDVGGLVGWNHDAVHSIISNCYATGKVIASGRTYSFAGGIVGNNRYDATIYDCVAANDSIIAISGTYINRVVGFSSGGYTGSIYNNYAFDSMVIQRNGLPQTITDSSAYAGVGKSLSTFQSLAFYATATNWHTGAWDTAVWDIREGETLPFLRWQEINCDAIFTITATAKGNGNITPNGDVFVNYRDNQTFTFSANNCYEIDSLWIDSIYLPESIAMGNYTFKNVVKNHTIEVSFKLKRYSSTVSASSCLGVPYYFGGQDLTRAGVYYDTLQTVHGCDSIIELVLAINPTYFTSVSASICKGDTYNFLGKLLTATNIYYDTLQSVHGCDSVIELTLMVNPTYFTPVSASICKGDTYNFLGKLLTAADIYHDTLQSIYGCDSVIELILTFKPIPNIEIIAITDNFCNDDFLVLQLITDGDSFLWNTGSTENEITVTKSGVYFVTSSINDCKDTAYYIIEECPCLTWIPNTFTPNNDGINDIFKPIISCSETLKEYKMYIYDRWGNLIFRSSDYSMGWNGEDNRGKIFATGVYLCVIEYVNSKNERIVKNISVTLLL